MTKRGHGAGTVGLALLIGALLTGCATLGSKSPGTVAVPAPPPSEAEYAIQPGDILSIKFYYHPDHDQPSVLVHNDGRIMLPLVGEVEAGGLTPSELSTRLEEKYSSNLRAPVIAVLIRTVYQYLVWVGGEVKHPGFVRYRPGLTAVQAIVAAGGPRDTGATDNCLLLRRVGGQEYRSSKLDLNKALYEGDTKADPVLGPQDVLFVPKTAIAKLNVLVDQYFTKMIPIRFTESVSKDLQPSGNQSNSSSTQGTRPATHPGTPPSSPPSGSSPPQSAPR